MVSCFLPNNITKGEKCLTAKDFIQSGRIHLQSREHTDPYLNGVIQTDLSTPIKGCMK